MKKFLKIKKTKSAIVVSAIVVAIFGVMQAMETKSATTDQIDLSVEVASAIDISCPSPSAFGTLTAGNPETVTATCTATSNGASGYVLQIKKDNATTLTSGGNSIADKTAWNSGTPNSAVWSGTGLGFRVMQTGTDEGYSTTWWGTDDTAPNALYAGLPASYVTILNDTTYSASSTETVIEFKVDVPASQATGTYTGTATFQGTVNP
ncbi:MAG TPA: hypothetical protein P5232_01400 [Candidatus Moranbacteria bacterium]|nr:hypothetical protein [Candidatus Moranbacteria bacterium]